MKNTQQHDQKGKGSIMKKWKRIKKEKVMEKKWSDNELYLMKWKEHD